MWDLRPSQSFSFFQTAAYPVAPFFRRDPSVKVVRPGRSSLASLAAAASSSITTVASRGDAFSRRTVSSFPFQHGASHP